MAFAGDASRFVGISVRPDSSAACLIQKVGVRSKSLPVAATVQVRQCQNKARNGQAIRCAMPTGKEQGVATTASSGDQSKGGLRGKLNKVVLAYSGGLDTSVIVPWLRENYGCEVVCFTADVGQGAIELEGLEKKAKASGACQLVVKDLNGEYIYPCLQAGAVYERKYLLGTSMARPVIAKAMVDVAKEVGADAVAVAHGCTGKGNDQVHFELTFYALNPEVVAPWREWDITGREDAIEYAKKHNVPVPVSKKSIYSRDRNLWHLSHEGDILEDPANEPKEDMYMMSVAPENAPSEPEPPYKTNGCVPLFSHFPPVLSRPPASSHTFFFLYKQKRERGKTAMNLDETAKSDRKILSSRGLALPHEVLMDPREGQEEVKLMESPKGGEEVRRGGGRAEDALREDEEAAAAAAALFIGERKAAAGMARFEEDPYAPLLPLEAGLIGAASKTRSIGSREFSKLGVWARNNRLTGRKFVISCPLRMPPYHNYKALLPKNPLRQSDGSCMVLATKYALEMRYCKKFGNNFHEDLIDLAVMKDELIRVGIFTPELGSVPEKILEYMMSNGVPVRRGINLKVVGHSEKYPWNASPVDVGEELFQNGAFVGTLYCDHKFLASEGSYKGCLMPLEGEPHGVVCYGYHFKRGALHIDILDNMIDTPHGPLGRVHIDAFDRFIIPEILQEAITRLSFLYNHKASTGLLLRRCAFNIMVDIRVLTADSSVRALAKPMLYIAKTF